MATICEKVRIQTVDYLHVEKAVLVPATDLEALEDTFVPLTWKQDPKCFKRFLRRCAEADFSLAD